MFFWIKSKASGSQGAKHSNKRFYFLKILLVVFKSNQTFTFLIAFQEILIYVAQKMSFARLGCLWMLNVNFMIFLRIISMTRTLVVPRRHLLHVGILVGRAMNK